MSETFEFPVSLEVFDVTGNGTTEYRVVISTTGGGGGGSGDVVGPASSTTGRAAEFADTTGKLLRAAPLTGDGGRPVLNASGVWSDALIGTAIARNTEVTAAVTAHSAATDPHGDRAYADAKVADAINDGTTTVAPSQNAVYDALALKAPLPRGAGSSAVGVSTSSFYVLPGRLQTYDASLLVMVAGTMYFSEHYTPYPITLSALRSRVVSSAASSLVRCLILACDSQFQPTSVIYQDTVDSTSSGLKDRTGLSIAVPAGPYLVACRAEGGAPSIVLVGQLPGPNVPTRSMMASGDSYSVAGMLKTGTGTGTVTGTPPQPDATWAGIVSGSQGSAVSARWTA